MLKNYLLIAVRNMMNKKVYSFLNIFGLTIGITCSILISLFIVNELSFDKFHKNKDRISRVISQVAFPGERETKYSICFGTLAPAISQEIPEVESVTRVFNQGSVNIEIENKRFYGNNLKFVDSTFLQIFSFPLIAGDAKTALITPDGILVTAKTAIKVFGTTNVINKSIKVESKIYFITAVLKDVPAASHLQFDLLANISTSPIKFLIEGSGLEFITYYFEKPNIDSKVTSEKISKLNSKLMLERWKDRGKKYLSITQPLTDIQLFSNDISDQLLHGNLQNIILSAVLVLLILVIAVINFINLLVAQSESRFKEVGMRKVLGAFKNDLIFQFVGEAFVTTLLSIFIALFLVELLVHPFGVMLGRNLEFESVINLNMFYFLTALTLFIAFSAGFYPSIYLSKYKIVDIFKRNLASNKKSNPLTKFLVIFQFSIVILLFACLIVIYSQINYIKTKDLGFNKENVVVIRGMNDSLVKHFETIKTKLLTNKDIISVASSGNPPGLGVSGQFINLVGVSENSGVSINHNRVSYDFLKTYKIQLVEGRDFSPEFQTDKKALILNETACKALNLKTPIGQLVDIGETAGPIIGVIKDFNYATLRQKIEPLVLTLNTRWFGVISVRIVSQNIPTTLKSITETLKSIDPLYTLDYKFEDDILDSLYKSETNVNNMIFSASIIAIVLAVLGLLSLTSFIVIKKRKEIGIRKILGADSTNIAFDLIVRIVSWVVVANVFAIPLAYWLSKKWLENYAYKIEIQWWMFAVPGFISFLIATLTISYQTIKIAMSNPIEAIRYE